MSPRYWQTLRSELGGRVLAAQLTEDHFGPFHPGIPSETTGDDRCDLEAHDHKPKCPDEHYGEIASRKRHCPSCHRARLNAKRRARWAKRRAA